MDQHIILFLNHKKYINAFSLFFHENLLHIYKTTTNQILLSIHLSNSDQWTLRHHLKFITDLGPLQKMS